MILKYVHSFIQHVNIRNFCSSVNTNMKILSDGLGLTELEAKTFTDKNKIVRNRNSEVLLESIMCCKKLGFSNEDILTNPLVLSYTAPHIYHHYHFLEEAGFNNLSAGVVSKAGQYLFTPISQLKSKGLIKKQVNVAKNFIKYIKNPPNFWTIDDLTDDYQLKDTHRKILTMYLKWKLNTTEDEILRLYRIYKLLSNRSFRIVEENLQIAESLNFSKEKLLKCAYLLHNYPEYPKAVLRDFPNLAGADLRFYMRQFPKLVTIAPKSYLKIYGTLKEFNISDESIRKYMGIFQLSPETVRLRLQEIQDHPELHFLFKHPRVLYLIQHIKKAKSRLSFLQELQIKCASIVVTEIDENFDKFIKEGQDMNLPHDVLRLLQNLFKADEETIRKKMKLHRFVCYVPFIEIQETFNFLKSKGFKRSQILRVMHVILYPKKKVEQALKDVLQSKTINAHFLSPVQKLNLIVYMMEKDHHFTGNGIWRTETLETPDEKTLE